MVEVSKRFSVSLDLLKNMLPEEILGVCNGVHVDADHVAQRAARCVVLSGYNDTQFIVDAGAVQAFRQKRLESDKQASQ